MWKDKLTRYLLRHPSARDFLKYLFSSKWLNDNKYYQKLMLNNAHRYASSPASESFGVSIETTLDCNSRCIMCAHSTQEMHGTMTKELFEKIIDDCHRNKISTVELCGYGEPLLDKYFFDRVKYLRKYNMNYGFFTNGSLLDSYKAKMLFELGGLVRVNFSVCGYDKNIYESVMVGLKRDNAYNNILNFLQLKNSLKQKNLIVGVLTVKTNINKKDMRRFCKYWLNQKGINYVITADLGDRTGDRDVNEIGPLGLMHRKDRRLMPCKKLWGVLYIYFDGRVAPCPDNDDKRQLIVGDVNKQTLREIYSGDILRNLRNLHLSNKREVHNVCGKCCHNLPWL
jgi:MoaA/NifB/PqqE/SkfB family radical SAM enzyme